MHLSTENMVNQTNSLSQVVEKSDSIDDSVAGIKSTTVDLKGKY